MAIKRGNYTKVPFATAGDKVKIPEEEDIVNKKVTKKTGYTKRYEKAPSDGGHYIERPVLNTLFNEIDNKLLELQLYGGRFYDPQIVSSGGYPIHSKVFVWYNAYTNKIHKDEASLDPNQRVMIYPITLISQIDNNKTDPCVYSNLFRYWWVDDGVPPGAVQMYITTSKDSTFTTPPGYLNMIANPPVEYKLDLYPRIKMVLTSRGSWDYIETLDKEENTKQVKYFRFKDLRGAFPRLFSNGSDIDQGRQPGNVQNFKMPRIYGEFGLFDDDSWSAQLSKPVFQKMYNITCLFENDEVDKNVFSTKKKMTDDARRYFASDRSREYTTGVNAQTDGHPVKGPLGNIAIFDTTLSFPDNTGDEIAPVNFTVQMIMKA